MEKFSRPDCRCCKNVCCTRRPASRPWRYAKIASRSTSVPRLYIHLRYIINIYIYISVGRWRVVAVKQWRDIISACILYNIYVCVCNTNKFSFVIKYYFAISVHPYLHFSPTRSLRVSQADCLGWDKRPNSSGHDLYLLLLFSVYYDIISLAKHCEYRRLHTIILNV